MDIIAVAAFAVAYELALFAAVIFAVFGIDDLAIDALSLSGLGRSEDEIVSATDDVDLRFAVFVPAWHEGAVIGEMLSRLSASWGDTDYRVYVGVYANDLATMLAVARAVEADPRVRMVTNDVPGPTTKGACLNRLWQAVSVDRADAGWRCDAVLLHDAEDVVDPAELVVLSRALAGADYVQIPVIPLIAPDGRWIGGHYADEFAEAHGKEMPVRSALGAPLPTAGVGCAFRFELLARAAGSVGPFPADSLTEDYELGIRLSAAGARGRFVAAHTRCGRRVASRAYFPSNIADAVRQKTRWLRGVALDGWDRLGWPVAAGAGPAARIAALWMLWRDRRAALAAAAIFAGYLALLVGIAGGALAWIGDSRVPAMGDLLGWLVAFNLVMLVWRLAVRAWFTGRGYGPRQAGLAILRQPVANIILVMTAWRAILGHIAGRRGGALVWDKTDHRIPLAATADVYAGEGR